MCGCVFGYMCVWLYGHKTFLVFNFIVLVNYGFTKVCFLWSTIMMYQQYHHHDHHIKFLQKQNLKKKISLSLVHAWIITKRNSFKWLKLVKPKRTKQRQKIRRKKKFFFFYPKWLFFWQFSASIHFIKEILTTTTTKTLSNK